MIIPSDTLLAFNGDSNPLEFKYYMITEILTDSEKRFSNDCGSGDGFDSLRYYLSTEPLTEILDRSVEMSYNVTIVNESITNAKVFRMSVSL